MLNFCSLLFISDKTNYIPFINSGAFWYTVRSSDGHLTHKIFRLETLKSPSKTSAKNSCLQLNGPRAIHCRGT